MKQNQYHFFLGVFVLCGAALTATGVTLLGAQSLWQDTRLLETYIDESVNGLEKGSPVKFRGIPVGKVTNITSVAGVYRTSHHYALVRAEVRLDALALPAGESFDVTFNQRVRDGLRVSLARGSLTGGPHLEAAYIDDKSKFPELPIDWEPALLYVPSTPSTLQRFEQSLDTVLENLARTDMQGLVASARDTLRRVDATLEKIDLEALGNDTRSLLAKGEDVLATAKGAVQAVEADIDETAAGIRASLRKAEDTLAKLDGILETGALRTSLERFAGFLERADAAVKQVGDLAARADGMVASAGQIVRGRSRELHIAISNLRAILENLTSLTGTLEQYPSLLFVGKAPKGASR